MLIPSKIQICCDLMMCTGCFFFNLLFKRISHDVAVWLGILLWEQQRDLCLTSVFTFDPGSCKQSNLLSVKGINCSWSWNNAGLGSEVPLHWQHQGAHIGYVCVCLGKGFSYVLLICKYLSRKMKKNLRKIQVQKPGGCLRDTSLMLQVSWHTRLFGNEHHAA